MKKAFEDCSCCDQQEPNTPTGRTTHDYNQENLFLGEKDGETWVIQEDARVAPNAEANGLSSNESSRSSRLDPSIKDQVQVRPNGKQNTYKALEESDDDADEDEDEASGAITPPPGIEKNKVKPQKNIKTQRKAKVTKTQRRNQRRRQRRQEPTNCVGLEVVTRSGRRGIIVEHDPSDTLLEMKVLFHDEAQPVADWFSGSDIFAWSQESKKNQKRCVN